MATRASEAERERDAAIEEAALAIFALQRVQKELDELKRSASDKLPQHHSCCCSEENQEEQLGEHCAENFAAFELIKKRNDDEKHMRPADTTAIQTLSDVKIAVLEQFQTLLPKDERHLYEEMHALYTEVARHEKLQERMADQIQTLLRENDDLEMRVQALEGQVTVAERRNHEWSLRSDLVSQKAQEAAEKDSLLKHQLDEIRDLQHRLDEKDSQIKQLLKMVEIQAAVISSEPSAPHEDQAGNFPGEYPTVDLTLENPFYGEYDEFEALADGFQHQNFNLLKLSRNVEGHVPSGNHSDSQRIHTAGEEEKTNLQDHRDLGSAKTVRILQAQLEMYARYFHRKNISKR